MKPTPIKYREEWLDRATQWMNVHLFGDSLPKYRVTCGWPSRSALANKQRRIGEHWSPKASADGTHEILVSPNLYEPTRVAGVLAHELVHALFPDDGHGRKFGAMARQIGLEGKLTATTEGEAFKQAVAPMLEELGPYPHAKLDGTKGPKKQGTRLLKVCCPDCDYTVRVTAKWIEIGLPTCPCGTEMEEAE